MWPWTLTSTLTFKLDLDSVKVNQHARNLGQRSFSETSGHTHTRTHTHTPNRSLYEWSVTVEISRDTVHWENHSNSDTSATKAWGETTAQNTAHYTRQRALKTATTWYRVLLTCRHRDTTSAQGLTACSTGEFASSNDHHPSRCKEHTGWTEADRSLAAAVDAAVPRALPTH